MQGEAERPRLDGARRAAAPLGRAFRVSLLLKGADAVLELIGGALFLIVAPSSVNALAVVLTQHELSEDPHDLIAAHLRDAVAHFGGSRFFGAVYLLSHGLGKIVLVFEIFRGRLWAYPGMLVLLAVFIAYQAYRLAHGFTLGMFALTVFDVVIVWLTCQEYRRQRQRLV
jgi:uncharacterized membrane protein